VAKTIIKFYKQPPQPTRRQPQATSITITVTPSTAIRRFIIAAFKG